MKHVDSPMAVNHRAESRAKTKLPNPSNLASNRKEDGKCPCTGLTLGEAARWYAMQNVPVFPLKVRGKEPLTKHGFKEATTDLDRIKAWWDKWPKANIGVPTGTRSGWLAVDIDPRNSGDRSLVDLETQYGQLPVTAQQKTGGGGQHFIFRHPHIPVPKELAPGIDLKGDGGYIVVAPSVHPSGRLYQWDAITAEADLLAPAIVPDWMIERISTPKISRGTPVEQSVKWGQGERNNKLTSLAGGMRSRGFTQAQLEELLLEENSKRCSPPLPESEVRKIAASIARYNHAPKEDSGKLSCGIRSRWPNPLGEAAYFGLVGEWVRKVKPHTEADPAALLIQFLVAFGNLIGRKPYFRVEADRHHTNLFAAIVGKTSKGRKGTSLGHVREVMKEIDETWCQKRIMSGLSTGEGLIWSLRDEMKETVKVKRGSKTHFEEQVVDAGIRDKRLLLTEPEFASVLQRVERDTNTLSATIRDAWDSGNLRVLTKQQSASTTDAHISIITHITGDELRRRLTSTEAANGFANRFLWVCSMRSNCLPDGGSMDQVDFSDLSRSLKDVADFASKVERIERDDEARKIWHKVYANLSEGKPGLFGSVTSRSESQVLRLACVYALLDRSAVVHADHLLAALEVWRYCEESARFIFGDAVGDAMADEIIRELRLHVGGMTRNDIREHFRRNKSSDEIGRALAALQEYGLARVIRSCEQENQMRPTERWFANAVNAINAVEEEETA